MSVAPPTEFMNLMDMKMHETRIVEGRVEDCLLTTVTVPVTVTVTAKVDND